MSGLTLLQSQLLLLVVLVIFLIWLILALREVVPNKKDYLRHLKNKVDKK